MSEVYIDDIDASVAYSGTWQATASEERSYHNTLHWTDTVGSKATFTFTGISVMAYGTVRGSDTPQSSYSIDGGSSTTFKPSSQVLSRYGVLFYTSPSLQNGQHTLVITNLNDTSTLFIDDFIIVTTGSASTSTHSSSSASTSTAAGPVGTSATGTAVSHSGTSSSSSSSSTNTATTLAQLGASASSGDGGSSTPGDIPSPSTTAAPDSATSHSGSSHPKAAILGAVVAVAIVALFIAVSVWRIRNRKRKKDLDPWAFSNSADSPEAPVTHAPVFYRADTPQMTEQPPPPPPPLEYPMTEPPPYEAEDIGHPAGPQVQVAGQPLRGSMKASG